MEQYNQKVMDHFQNPQNMGEIANADGIGKVGNPKCGDVMMITIKVGEDEERKEYIEDIKFKTLGCAAAIASSSVTTELAKGKTLEQAYKMTKDDINNALGKLPAPKYHCSILAEEGIKKAIDDYRSKSK